MQMARTEMGARYSLQRERKVHTMADTNEQSEQPAGTLAEQADRISWQTPGYTVVETALEVTAYSLSAR